MRSATDSVAKLNGKIDFGDMANDCEDAINQFREAAK